MADDQNTKGPVARVMRPVETFNGNTGEPPVLPQSAGPLLPEGPNDGEWIDKLFTARANEPLNFAPVNRRIRDRTVASAEAEVLQDSKTGTKIAAQAKPYMPKLTTPDPWEGSTDGV